MVDEMMEILDESLAYYRPEFCEDSHKKLIRMLRKLDVNHWGWTYFQNDCRVEIVVPPGASFAFQYLKVGDHLFTHTDDRLQSGREFEGHHQAL